ncbi:uncharacterized protein BCR38DRAFT_472016 [Pseudomassariella vexata]|uniref:Uncharacterized protein n=1 Tax=Pseudomassariella vexata TaxID=1141098 RepID=A0A1Y2EA43_9PEZI|nr:uncharacterized protein BCR38DRAFT_472016 [Pseudomassariella vexata]ORY68458.1 hypothetical protein BCR38DRAFT_472016 [Pseudomassariella vexata]
MQFSVSITLSALALFAGSVLGDLHSQCTCMNGDSAIARITTDACTAYTAAAYQWGTATYDEASSECVADSGSNIAGDQWQSACQEVAKAGYACADGVGTCYASVDDVKGSCT